MNPLSSHLRRSRRRAGGFSVLYLSIAMTLVFAFASLATDYGQVQVAKSQLRAATDSAARAAAGALGTVSTAQNLAYDFAYQNRCDGTPVVIDRDKDVEFGDWSVSNKTFTPLTGANRQYANAIRVSAERTIPLFFGRILGANTCQVRAVSVAAVVPPGFGLVGIDFIKLNGNTTASYWSSSGTTGGNSGNVASNGSVTSSKNANIQGTVWTLPGATVTGIPTTAQRTLSAPLNYPNGNAAPYSTTYNDNSQIWGVTPTAALDLNVNANKTAYFPAGNYVLNNVSVSSNSQIVCLGGPVTIYFYGNFTMSGRTTTAANLPRNLTIVGIPKPNGSAPGYIDISSSSALYASIYAPQSPITLGGSGAIYGAIVGKSIDLKGTSDIYYDLSVEGGNGVVQLVQ